MARNRGKDKGGDGPNIPAPAPGDHEAQKRVFVETLAGYGMDPAEIGLLLIPQISGEEVRQRYAVELEMGPAKANLETVAQLRKSIKSGNVTAAIYWTKVHMGWSDGRSLDAKDRRAAKETEEPPPAMPTAEQIAAGILPFRRK